MLRDDLSPLSIQSQYQRQNVHITSQAGKHRGLNEHRHGTPEITMRELPQRQQKDYNCALNTLFWIF